MSMRCHIILKRKRRGGRVDHRSQFMLICTFFNDHVMQEKYKRLETVLKAESEKKEKGDRSRLPDPPKTAQDIWQQSVIGDYLARFKVCATPRPQNTNL